VKPLISALLTIILSMSLAHCKEKPKGLDEKPSAPKIENYMVGVKPGAVIRDAPSLKGRIVATLVYGTKVQIVRKGVAEETILGLTGPWYQIAAQDRSGYVFSPLLIQESERFFFTIVNEKAERQYSDADAVVSDSRCQQFSSNTFPGNFEGGCLDLDGDGSCAPYDVIMRRNGSFLKLANHPPLTGGKWTREKDRIKLDVVMDCVDWCSEQDGDRSNCIQGCSRFEPSSDELTLSDGVFSLHGENFNCILDYRDE